MTRAQIMPLLLVMLATLGLGGCPGPSGNPDVLWLDLDGSELRVRLVDSEPPRF